MKLRRVLLVCFLVGGFWYVTAHGVPWFSRSPLGGQLSEKLPGAPVSGLSTIEANAQPAFDSEEINNISIYKKVSPAVVNITSSAMAFDFFYGMVPQQGQGSGFILDKTGHVLTNYHVIADASRIEVTLSDKHKYKAKVVGADKSHDLALLQIDAPNLSPVILANSADLVVGQKVFAIGNPFGLSGTMTRGIISAIRPIRSPSGSAIEDAIQTDAAINPGNSGGPLLNSRGEVIGINTMIASNGADQSSGIGFAIPINSAKVVLADLAKYGRVRRPTMGIVSLPIGPDLAEQMGLAADYGVLIQHVLPNGAAERAGMRGGKQQAYLGNTPIFLGGDMIVAIDGEEVTNTQDISAIMDKHQIGDTITVTFYRGRSKMSAKLILGEARDVAA
jgi:S1-C subfamily serine protease